jgi:hypothetical protein
MFVRSKDDIRLFAISVVVIRLMGAVLRLFPFLPLILGI